MDGNELQYTQGRNEVRWHQGQEASLAPPCSNQWGLSEANALNWRKYLWHCWDFSAPAQRFGAPVVIWRPVKCAPVVTPLLLQHRPSPVFPPILPKKSYNQSISATELFWKQAFTGWRRISSLRATPKRFRNEYLTQKNIFAIESSIFSKLRTA